MQDVKPVSGSPSQPQKKKQLVISSLPVWEREFLRAKHAADYLSISKSHFHALVREGVLPEGKLISGAIRVWKREMLQQAAQKMWAGC